MAWCQICNGYYFFNPEHHKCPPVWRVGFEDEDSEYPYEVRALSPEAAAEEAAHSYDSNGEYYLCQGNSLKATVRGENGEVVEVMVFGEMIPNYSAERIEVVNTETEPALEGEAI